MVFHAAMTNATGRRWAWAVILCAGLALGGCSPKQENSVVGKWAKGNDTIVTFTADGKVINQAGISTEEMSYTVQDGTTLFLKPKDLPMSLQYTITFPSADEMVLTLRPPKGAAASAQPPEQSHFTRVKE
jgi:hypothetical protein